MRAAPAAMKPTQAPNIDPNRKTVANVSQQLPKQLIALAAEPHIYPMVARPKLTRTPPTRGVAKIGSNAPLRLTQRAAEEKVARMQHIAFLRRGPLL